MGIIGQKFKLFLQRCRTDTSSVNDSELDRGRANKDGDRLVQRRDIPPFTITVTFKVKSQSYDEHINFFKKICKENLGEIKECSIVYPVDEDIMGLIREEFRKEFVVGKGPRDESCPFIGGEPFVDGDNV